MRANIQTESARHTTFSDRSRIFLIIVDSLANDAHRGPAHEGCCAECGHYVVVDDGPFHERENHRAEDIAEDDCSGEAASEARAGARRIEDKGEECP